MCAPEWLLVWFVRYFIKFRAVFKIIYLVYSQKCATEVSLVQIFMNLKYFEFLKIILDSKII